MFRRWPNGDSHDCVAADRRKRPPGHWALVFRIVFACAMTGTTIAISAGCDSEEPDIFVRTEVRTPAVPSHLRVSAVTSNPASSDSSNAMPGMAWDLPEGWTQEAASTPFRVATLRSPDGRLEVAVTFFADDRATVEANLNRWRNELDLEPVSASQADAQVSRHPLKTPDDRLVYRRASVSDASHQRQTHVAWIHRDNFGSWYFTARGTSETFADHLDGLWAIADSFTLASDAALTAAAIEAGVMEPQAETPSAPTTTVAVPMDQLDLPDTSGWTPFEFAVDDETARGRIPEGWQVDVEPRQRILASLTQRSDDNHAATIEISRFSGDVGGMQANAIRWIRQLGLTPETATADVLSMTNHQVPIAMLVIAPLDHQPDSETFTVAAIRDADSTWFIKLRSPSAAGPATYPAFTAFVEALALPLAQPVPEEGWQ